MKIVIEIPDNEIPTKQDIVTVDLHFIDGKVCECDYPFMELPKGHGELIDRGQALNECYRITVDGDVFEVVQYETLLGVPTIIEADKGA